MSANAWSGPPVLRACPTRLGVGGLSTRLGFPTADSTDPEASRDATRSALARAIGRDATALAWLRQVHGATVHVADAPGFCGEGDALVTDDDTVVPLVSVADCCPVLLWQPDRTVRGVAHAGWRGLVAGVLQATVEAMVDRGAQPLELRAWVGPSIGPCCFEVGTEVADHFAADCVRRASPRPYVDLRAASRRTLAHAGLAPEHISVATDCTSCRADLYWSYRRDGGICSRHLAYLA